MFSLLEWVADNETMLSGLAALVVIIGVVFSPMGAGVRATMARRGNLASTDGESGGSVQGPGTGQNFASFPPLITDKPSVAVLPFTNMSKDEDKEFFADGMTEDIITGLSCDSRLFVIARNSTFAYKGQSPNISTVGRELGVRYVLEGSIRLINDRLRITAQLIETETGAHVWADKIDRPAIDIFDVQDEVVDSIVTTLCANVGVAEGKRARRQPPESLKAWELCIQAETIWIGQLTATAPRDALELTQKATEIEPGYGFGWVFLGYLLSMKMPMLISENIPEDAKQAIELAHKGVALAPEDPALLGYAGYTVLWAGEASLGVDYLERSLSINPNSGIFRQAYGTALMVASRHEEALEQFELFFRQSPKDPSAGRAYHFRGLVQLMLGDFEAAEKSTLLTIKHAPTFLWGHVTHGAVLAGLGQEDAAQDSIRKLHELGPHWTLEKLHEFIIFFYKNKDDAEKLNSLIEQAWVD